MIWNDTFRALEENLQALYCSDSPRDNHHLSESSVLLLNQNDTKPSAHIDNNFLFFHFFKDYTINSPAPPKTREQKRMKA